MGGFKFEQSLGLCCRGDGEEQALVASLLRISMVSNSPICACCNQSDMSTSLDLDLLQFTNKGKPQPGAELQGGPRTTMCSAHTKPIDTGSLDPEQPNIEYIGASTAFRQYASCDPSQIRPIYTPSYPLLCCADVWRWRAGGRRRMTSSTAAAHVGH